MNFKEYVEQLNEFLLNNPNVAEHPVYIGDTYTGTFTEITWVPSLGYVEGSDFIECKENKITSVLLN